MAPGAAKLWQVGLEMGEDGSMSDDLRNSIYLWVAAILACGLIFGTPHLGFLDGLAESWVGQALQVLGILGFGRAVWKLWARRASNRDPPQP